MLEIYALLQCLTVCLDATSLRQLGAIVPAFLSMTGRVTMLGISRWTDEGGSYRTVQRFFTAPINWGKLHWCFIRHKLWDAEATYILVGDEVVVTKAGKHTYGLDRFFSSLYKRPVPGLCFFNFSLINTKTRTAYPVLSEQVVREQVGDPKAAKTKKRKNRKNANCPSKKESQADPKAVRIKNSLTYPPICALSKPISKRSWLGSVWICVWSMWCWMGHLGITMRCKWSGNVTGT